MSGDKARRRRTCPPQRDVRRRLECGCPTAFRVCHAPIRRFSLSPSRRPILPLADSPLRRGGRNPAFLLKFEICPLKFTACYVPPLPSDPIQVNPTQSNLACHRTTLDVLCSMFAPNPQSDAPSPPRRFSPSPSPCPLAGLKPNGTVSPFRASRCHSFTTCNLPVPNLLHP